MWIKFLADHMQKAAKDGEQDKSFKTGDIIEVEEKVAKALIELGLAEETKEPEIDEDMAKSLETLQKGIESTIEKALSSAFEGLGKKFEEGFEFSNFAEPKNPHAELTKSYGWKDPDHFYRAIYNKSVGNDLLPGMEYLSKAPSGQNISSDSEGNFLVPETISDSIWTNMMEEPTSILPQTLQMTTAGNTMKVRTMFESSRKEGVGQRNAGIIAYWVDEAEQLTATKMTVGKHTLELHKLAALTYATEEMLEDSGFSITNLFNQLVPRAINFKVADALFNGTGVGKPQGVLKSDALVVVARTTGVERVSHRDVSDMYWRNSNRGQAIWYAHESEAQNLEFTYFDDDTTNKRPIYFLADGSGLTQSPFGRMYNRPVVPMEFLKGSGGEGSLCFIDWSDYATLTKANGGIKFASSIHLRFDFDEQAFRWTFRIDGRSLWTGSREDLLGDTTRSPYTALGGIGASSSGL